MNTTPTTPLPELNPDLAAYFPPPDLWAETLSMGTDALRREKRDMILQECRILTVAALARRVLLDAGGDFPDTDPPLFPELPRPAFGTPPGGHLRMMLEAARAAMLGEGQGELAAALERLQDAATYPKGPEDAGGRSLAQEAARAVLFELQMAFLKVRHWRGVLFGLLCGRLGMEALKTRVLYALHKATPAPSSPQTQGETESDNAAVVMECGALLARIAADAAAAKHAAAGAHAEAARGRLAAEDAAAAGRAAEAAAHTTGEHIMATIHTATAQLEERKRKRDSAEAIVEACKRFEEATKDEAGAQIAIMEGVLGDMVEEGWTIADWPTSERQTMLALQERRSVSRGFLKHWRVWRQMKPRPQTGAEYASAKAAKKARAREAKKAEACDTADAPGDRRAFRIAIFRDTVARVLSPTSGLPLSPTIDADTRFYSAELPPGRPAAPDAPSTPIEVREGDCLSVARELVEGGEAETCVLNMASRHTPGGGVLSGCGAQEEHLFRASDYFRSLYPYAATFNPREYGLTPARESYPLNPDNGGIFSRGVTVFRGPEADGYPLLETPWRCNFVAVPAVNCPDTFLDVQGGIRLAPEMEEATRRKIRAILRIARANGQRALVLSAFGCGAFRNPPRHMAELFREELSTPEFRAAFKRIVFAIFDDHNARGTGNLQPFREVFSSDGV